MAGQIDISSGTEDLTSGLEALTESLASPEAQSALLDMFFAVGATPEQIDAACESLDASLVDAVNPKADQGGECKCVKRPALVSKVIDDEGNALITILYDGNPTTGGSEMGVITGLLDTASETDVVDITIITTLFDFSSPKSNIFAVLPLLSAIKRCKAHVITRAGCLCSLGDCAVWLSGDEPLMSPMGWIAVRQPMACGGGTMQAAEFRVEDFKKQVSVFTDFIVSKGLFSKDEIDRMFEEEGMLSLCGDELTERLKSLKL